TATATFSIITSPMTISNRSSHDATAVSADATHTCTAVRIAAVNLSLMVPSFHLATASSTILRTTVNTPATPTANAPSTASSADGSRLMPTPANQATIPVTAAATAVRTAAITWSRIGFLLSGWLRGSGRQVEQAAVPNRFDRFRLQGVDAALHHRMRQSDPVQVAARFDPVVRVLEAWVVVVEAGGHMNTVSQTWHV